MIRPHLIFLSTVCSSLLIMGCQETPLLPAGRVDALIPAPQSVTGLPGEFRCEGVLNAVWPEDWKAEQEVVQDWFAKAGIQLQAGSGGLVFRRLEQMDGEEAYALQVDAEGMAIEAATSAGLFRGWTTLRKMLPVECEMGCDDGFTLSGVRIEDAPAFGHRGLLLDGCRHFQDVEFVKKQIDLLALHGMNVLHWHLTEDQGWRLAIPSRPLLTEVAAWREEADGSRHGGFYTREEVQSIVAYASARHIEVIPEIEMPGHSSAALAAYPELGCTGESLEVPARWGVFKDIYCAGSEETFTFLEEVMDEVVELFPSTRIHIGGDEAPKVRWEACSRCQQRIRDEGLANEEELQRWFIGRMGRYLKGKGRTIIGWDEILEGGLPEGAAVQSWRGMGGAAEAVHLGADVVVSPTSHCYLDYPLRSTDLEEAYSFNPMPDSLAQGPGRILGGEGNMWTEHAPQELVESKVYPRLTALAEVYWSGPNFTGRPNAYADFLRRMDGHYQRMDAVGVDYGLESPPFDLKTSSNAEGRLLAEVVPKGRGVDGRGTWSGSGDSLRAGVPFVVDGPGEVRMEVGRRGQWSGIEERYALDGHRAVYRPLKLDYVPSPWYTGGGDSALVDGRLGSADFRDGAWQAKQGQDMSATVDLGEVRPIQALGTGVYLYQDAWIFQPERIIWEGSLDGKDWFDLAQSETAAALKRDDRQMRLDVSVQSMAPGMEARYVRMTAINAGPCPNWHAAARSESWLFLDEMVVR